MWRQRDRSEVTCIACGEQVPRAEAREYDKHGDRWDRAEKEFEHLCKPCYRDLCHQPRKGLEELLADIEAEGVSRADFVARYTELVEEEYGSTESSE
jgi:hypothetical protein